jgi:hypothetical protein
MNMNYGFAVCVGHIVPGMGRMLVTKDSLTGRGGPAGDEGLSLALRERGTFPGRNSVTAGKKMGKGPKSFPARLV